MVLQITQYRFLLQLIKANSYRKMQNTSEKILIDSSAMRDSVAKSPIDIVFQNIVYTIEVESKQQTSSLPCKTQYEPKQLLKNISGIFRAGRVSSIMGASGAGKTTLLNVLACRVPRKNLQGSVYANSLEYRFEEFGDFANYVMQADVLMQTLTVRETLEFAANLKLNIPSEQKKKVIQNLSNQLKLEKCLDVKVGGTLIKGISGGQKKRTSIAFELISDPQVLMLDEPTSGLDSLTSYIIVRYMKRLAQTRGKTIIMTIHQPNSDIYALFDDLTLMVEGKLIYQGDSKRAPDYFGRNFSLRGPAFSNPADYFMSIMHQEDKKNVQRYPVYFQSYEKEIAPQVKSLIDNRSVTQIQKRTVQVSTGTSFCTLLWRDYTNTVRNPMMIQLRIIQTIFLAVYIGGLYARFTGDYFQEQNWRSLTGFFFFIAINNMMMALVPVTLVFPLERQVFLKEQGSKMYTTLPYWMAHNIIQLPYLIIFPLISCLIMYWFVGLSSSAQQFFTLYLITYLIYFNGASFGLMLGSIILDAKSISTITPVILLPVVLFSGFFKNRDNLPRWIGWLEYISPIKYTFTSSLENQLLYVSSRVGELNFDVSLWASVGILVAMGIFFRLLSLFFLWALRTKLE